WRGTRRCRPGPGRKGTSSWRADRCRHRIGAPGCRISSWPPWGWAGVLEPASWLEGASFLKIPRWAKASPWARLPLGTGPGPSSSGHDEYPAVAPDKVAAARIAWWSWRTLCRRNPIPRSHHEREERTLRTPFHSGRSRGPRHAGGSLAGHRHRAGYFGLVRAG